MAERGGFWVFWTGAVRLGDNFEPEKYEYEVSFAGGGAIKRTRWGYLTCQVRNVHYAHNYIYIGEISNATRIGTLDVQESKKEWHTQVFVIKDDHWNAADGQDKIIFTARNKTGGFTGEVDDIWIADPVIHFINI